MTDQTEVERAAGLYETALQDRRGKQCSEKQFFAAIEQAVGDVKNLLVLEGLEESRAAQLAEAGKLFARAKQRGRI
jgi:hypothetical protein